MGDSANSQGVSALWSLFENQEAALSGLLPL
jgi:hypothetical protein